MVVCSRVHILMLAVSLWTASSHAYGWGWSTLDNQFSSAQQGASDLADLAQERLKKEKSQIVFVSLSRCDLDSSWCESFRSMFEHRLVQSGINFLPEEKRDEIRKKIAEEGLYQQSSMMVDVKRAVELGKQESIQAFMSIVISGNSQDAFAKVQSINMERAVVSVSEGVRIYHREKTSRPFSSYLSAITYTTIGAGLTYLGLDVASKEKQHAENSFEKYQTATDSIDAQKYRKKTKTHDTNASYANTGAVIGVSVALYGLYNFFYSDADDYTFQEFKVERAEIQRANPLKPMLVLEDSGPTIGLGLSWDMR